MNRNVMVLLWPVLAMAGCDPGLFGSSSHAVGTFALDLGAEPPAIVLQEQPQAPPACFSVIDVVELSISGGRPPVLTLVVEEPEIVFRNVRVRTGTSVFSATIFSNNGSVLYQGERTERIEVDGFQVAVAVEGRSPVLTVCAVVDWFFVINGAGRCANGLLAVFNSGVDTLRWTVESPLRSTGESGAGDGEVLQFSHCVQEEPATLRVRVTSEVGEIDETFTPPS